MALTRDKRNLFFMVGALLAVMAFLQFLSYDILIPSQDLPHKSSLRKLQPIPRQPHTDLTNATVANEGIVASQAAPPRCRNALCTFLDVTIESRNAGRIVFLLYDEKRPKSAENFRALCTGEKGVSPSGTRLHYKGAAFSRVVHNILVQGGDIQKGRAADAARESIYGEAFDIESRDDTLHERGLLAMAGKVKSGSEFFITLDSVAELDNQYAVLGVVVEGMEVVDKINSVPLNDGGEPTVSVTISESGQL